MHSWQAGGWNDQRMGPQAQIERQEHKRAGMPFITKQRQQPRLVKHRVTIARIRPTRNLNAVRAGVERRRCRASERTRQQRAERAGAPLTAYHARSRPGGLDGCAERMAVVNARNAVANSMELPGRTRSGGIWNENAR